MIAVERSGLLYGPWTYQIRILTTWSIRITAFTSQYFCVSIPHSVARGIVPCPHTHIVNKIFWKVLLQTFITDALLQMNAVRFWNQTVKWKVTANSTLRGDTQCQFVSSSEFPVHKNFCKGAITSKIKHAIILKTSHAWLAQLLQPSLAFCFSLQPMMAHRHWLQAKTKC